LTNKSEKISEKDIKLKDNEKIIEELTRKNEKLEEELDYHINQSKQWKESFNRTRNEINKGNQIIRHLQNELRSTKSKSKIKDEVTIKQEKLLEERHNTIKEQEKRIEEIKSQLKEKIDKIQTLSDQNEKISKELSESNERLEESTNVINYLQKQLNEDALSRPIGVSSFKTNKYSTFDFDKYSSPVAQNDYKLRSHTSILNKDNIPTTSSATTKNSYKASSLYGSSNLNNNIGLNSSNLMYNKPLHGLNKENITKILNPKLKSNTTIPRSILENSNYENIKSHLPSTLLELSTKSPYDRITNQNRESNDNSTIPSKITINKPLDYNRFTITTSIPSSHNTTQAKATSIPLKSNYF
jgi:DNA repair exonuclease SbcCD ATPase subunit